MNRRPLNLNRLTRLASLAGLGAAMAAGCHREPEPAAGGAAPRAAALPSMTHPSASGDTRLSPLIQAVKAGNGDQVTSLLSKGADVQSADSLGRTPLMFAPDAKMAKLLLDKGAKIAAVDNLGETALIHAAGDNDRILGSASPARSGEDDADTALVRLLLSHHADPNAASQDGTTALLAAIARHKVVAGPLDIVGSQRARVRKAQQLLDAGANVNIHTRTETVDHLSAGTTPLMAAALNGDPALIRTLLAKGAEVNDKDQAGTTALMNAARMGNADLVQLLIDNHADVNARSSQGETPLSQASRLKSRGHARCVELLTKAGAKG
jgi:ankyrin repeat protein